MVVLHPQGHYDLIRQDIPTRGHGRQSLKGSLGMRQTTRIWMSLLALAGTMLSACTRVEVFRPLPARPVPPPSAFVHRLATPAVEIYWNCTRSRLGVLHFDGMARNVGGREVRLLQLGLKGVDAINLLQDAAALPEIVLYPGEFSPFRLRLPIKGGGARFDLLYQYRVVPPAYLPNPPPATEERFTAQDVCSETRYRAR